MCVCCVVCLRVCASLYKVPRPRKRGQLDGTCLIRRRLRLAHVRYLLPPALLSQTRSRHNARTYTHRERDRQTNRETARQRDRETARQTDRQTDRRQTDTVSTRLHIKHTERGREGERESARERERGREGERACDR